MNDEKINADQNQIDALMAIGLFLALFGLTVLVAVFFTETYHGKITNSICGLLLLVTAMGMIFRSKGKSEK